MNFILFLIIGGVAGWLAGNFMKGSGYGLLQNIAIGVIGSVFGGGMLGVLGISTSGMIGSLISATIGAVVLIYIVNRLKKAD